MQVIKFHACLAEVKIDAPLRYECSIVEVNAADVFCNCRIKVGQVMSVENNPLAVYFRITNPKLSKEAEIIAFMQRWAPLSSVMSLRPIMYEPL